MNDRYTIYTDNDVILKLEATPNVGYTLHCTVYNWSAKIYNRLLEVWAELTYLLQDEGITELFIYAHNYQAYKFASMFGFEPTSKVGITTAGTEHRLWRYDNA